MVAVVMPPSTSSVARDRWRSSRARIRRILSVEAGRYDWPPNPGIDRHHEHEIDVGHDLLQVRQRRAGIEGESGAHAPLTDRGELTLDVHRGLGVEGEPVGSGIGVFRDVSAIRNWSKAGYT